MEKPFISFVVTARNDNYGGNWQNRINAFLKVLAYQAERVNLPIELVFTEYNPVHGKRLMAEELIVPKNPFFEARFIIVPNEFHQRLPDSEKVSVCEFIGKNIAARRARGEYICATNPDVLFSDDLFDFFASKKFDKKAYYRLNRHDLSTMWIDPNKSAEKILEDARSEVIKVLYTTETIYLSWKEWFSVLIHGRRLRMLSWCPLFNPIRRKKIMNEMAIHTNAAGDFLMMHRDSWDTVGGYDQVTVGSGVLDGYILYTLFCKDIHQEILPYPLYHLYHHHKGVKYLASHVKFREDAKKMLETRIPYKINPVDWGFPQGGFKEIAK